MRKIGLSLLVIVLSLAAGMAFAIDIPQITTWTIGNGCSPQFPCPGLSIQGEGDLTGFGDVLLAPLYDVRNLKDPNLPGNVGTISHPQATLISIVNTDDSFGVLARLRFREFKRSFECLDLDIILTPNDVWIAQVVLAGDGITPQLNQPTGAGSRFVSQVPASANDLLVTDLVPEDPSGLLFSTVNIETGDITRCQYGYYEVIAEERIPEFPVPGTFNWQRLGTVNAVGQYSPVASPPGTITGPVAGPNGITGGRDVEAVLMGNTYVIRPDIAISHQYNDTAIAHFAVDAAGIWQAIGPGTTAPNLRDSVQGGGTGNSNRGAGGLDNLEALLSKRFVDFQYVDQGAQGGFDPNDTSLTPVSTSVVVTFPTKWVHYNPVAPFVLLSPPFTGLREAEGDGTPFGEIVNFSIFDRSEHPLVPPGCAVSPCQQGQIRRLPFEVNIVGLKPLDNYGTPTLNFADFRNNVGIPTANSQSTPPQKFFSGWSEIDLSPHLGFTSGDVRTFPQGKALAPTPPGNPFGQFSFFNNLFNAYRGLPAIGIVMTEFFNDAVVGYFGNTVPWQYGVDWRVIPPDTFLDR